MSNMRQILKRGRPTLRMEAGGIVKPMNGPVGLAEVTPEYSAAADATHKANLADGASQLANLQKMNGESSPTAAPTAPTAPVHDAAWGVKQGLATSLLNSFHPLPVPMKHGGSLRTGMGGEVPGHGHGDKIPAKYEPGEFVVSNDMLAAQPGLEQHLHNLRDGVLEAQGKDPAAVDASQMKKAGLRAMMGRDGEYQTPPVRNAVTGDPAPFVSAAETRASWPKGVIDPADLDLRNTAPGSQPMPAASVTADGIKLNRLRNASNAAAAAPGNVSVPPVQPAQKVSVADQLRAMNQPGIDSRNAEYALHVDGKIPENPFDAGAKDAEILKARTAGWKPGTPSGAEPKPVAPAAAPNLLENVVTETPEAAPKPTGMNRIPGVQSIKGGYNALRNGVGAASDVAGTAYSGAKNLAGTAVRTVGPAVLQGGAGAIAGLAMRNLPTGADATHDDIAAAEAWRKKSGVSQIPGDTSHGPTPGRVDNWWSDTQTGRDLNNAINAVAPEVGGIGRVVMGGTKLADAALKYAPVVANVLGGVGAGANLSRAQDATPATPAPVDPANQTEAYRKRTGLPLDKRVQATGDTDVRNHDFTGELNAMPKNLPQGLRDNVVYKTVDPKTGRVTYSGRNVGVNKNGETEMVDGMGRSSKMLNGNNANFVRDDQTGKTAYGNNSGQVYDGTGAMKTGPAGDAEIRALHAAGLRGDTAALEGYYAARGQGFGGKPVEQIRAEQEEANAPKRGEFGYNHYIANKTALRAQDITKRGQDMDLEGRLAPTRLAAMQAKQFQQIMGAAGKSGADPVALAVQSGAHMDVIKQIQAHQKEQQTIGDTQSKAMDDAFKNQFVRTDDKGNVHRDEQAEAIAAAQFRTLTGGRNLNPTELAAARNDAINHAKAVQGFQQTTRNRNDSFYKNWMPWTEKEAMPTALPENVNRSKVGWAEGAYTGHGLERGDWQVGDQELPATTDQGVLNYLDRVAKARKQLRD